MNYHTDLEQSAVQINSEEKGKICAHFVFGEKLSLFKGHFPGNPILPGVIQIEMVKYCLENIIQEPLFLQKVNKTKFTSLIHPDKAVMVEINFDTSEKGGFDARAVVRVENVVAGKVIMTLTRQI